MMRCTNTCGRYRYGIRIMMARSAPRLIRIAAIALVLSCCCYVQAYGFPATSTSSRVGRQHAIIASPNNNAGSTSISRSMSGSRHSLRPSAPVTRPIGQRSTPGMLANSNSAAANQDDSSSGGGRGRKRRAALSKFLAVSSTARKAVSKARTKVLSIMTITRRKRRNMLAAAAMMLSLLAFTQLQHQEGTAVAGPDAAVSAPSGPQVVKVASNGDGTRASQYQQTGQGQGRSSSGTDVLRVGNAKIGRKAGSAMRDSTAHHTVSARASARPSTIQKKSTPSTPPMAFGTKTKSETPKESIDKATQRTIRDALIDLQKYMEGPKSDTLILLLATALVTPLCKQVGISPILGFLGAGMMLGPNAAGLISGIHTTETLAELGIVFFLFEMGIELSFERLKSMRRDVFGLGLSQFLGTAVAVAAIGKVAFNLPGNALVVLGGGLALSSSAFVLQLLKDKDQLATRFGKASFGILLLQDLAVVPLLVVTPILAGGGQGLGAALGSALVKATIALGSIAFAGRVVLNPLFNTVAKARTQEAFLGVILLTVLGMSFLTEGLGLSNTLGAFLAGVLLSETKYRYQIEADIAPFRGILLGLFFVTVGFEIDVGLVLSQLPLVSAVVLGIIFVKAAVAALASMAFGLSLSTSLQTGFIVSQAGEFAFVAFGLAKSLGIFTPSQTKFLLTCVSLTMALTPFLSSLGGNIAKKLEEGSDYTHYLGQDKEALELKESDDFVIVIGYGIVGKVVTDLLDRKFIRYQCLEVNPNKAIEARNKGLPVFYGDVGRPEVAEAFNVGKAKAVIVTIADKAEANRAIISLRRMYPQMKIFARAANADHAQRLQSTLDVAAMVPVVPEDNVLLTLPFGGAVLKSLGAQPEEVNAILESKRKDVLSGRGLAETEQEAALMQLGLIPDEDDSKKRIKETSGEVDVIATVTENVESTSYDDEEQVKEDPEMARIEEIKEKSPMVAQVIEANILASEKKEEVAPVEGMEEVAVAIEAIAGDISAADEENEDD